MSSNTKSLVIVESPAKAKTIRKYLGPSYVVKASLGHVKDLPKSKLGVAVERSFEPEYKVIPGKKKVLGELVKAAHQVDHVFLALDPDREGEAIAYHIAEELGVDPSTLKRVLFNEITKKGITEGLAHPLALNTRRYESQQARRILDRLVGYEISPILWKKVRRGLSAGRVQSVVVRLIVDREAEIGRFVPVEFWRIAARLEGKLPPSFAARYVGIAGEKTEIGNGQVAQTVVDELQRATYVVAGVDKKERRRAPPPPYITSRMQQDAARRYRFTAKRTMMVAQQLYEGVELGAEGSVGLITYMRTDSTRLADDALNEVRLYIGERFGAEALPPKANIYKSRKDAQDAHEAIRPTSVYYTPEMVAPFLTPDQRKLYAMIWERFVSCQMKPALYDQTVVEIAADRHRLRASGSILRFRGFLEVTADPEPPSAVGNGEAEEESSEVPVLTVGEPLRLTGEGVTAEQKFTQPPPRFTEGTLIRELEERGIGRPSTYATILTTIQDRKYVEKEEGKLKPSELGRIVTERLVLHFPNILDVDFTASMEESLDGIEEGREDWIALLARFYGPFHKDVQLALLEMKDVRDLVEKSDETCEICSRPMVVKWGRNGRFLACSGYPECRGTREISASGQVQPSPQPTDIVCESCGKPMVRKRGRFGEFLACTGYPACKATRSLPTGIFCPRADCGGELVERRTKRGRVFFGCANFKSKSCDFVVWGQPVKEPCPECGSPFLIVGAQRKGDRELRCPSEACSYKRLES